MNNKLITIETLPVIKYHLEQLSVEIKEKVNRANNLVVNDETIKEVKQVRAELNKEFNELETQRKTVKQAIMQKYDEFEEIYKDNVSNLYKQADADLKDKIDNVENQLKQEKQEELELFAKEYFDINNIETIVNFDDIGLNITLSASMKSLKEQIVSFSERISSDLELIKLEEFSDEILIEYKNNLDFSKSKLNVIARKKQLEELQKRQQELEKQHEEEQKMVEKVEEAVEELSTPKEIIEDEDVITCTFTVTGTKEQILRIKKLIIEMGLEYE